MFIYNQYLYTRSFRRSKVRIFYISPLPFPHRATKLKTNHKTTLHDPQIGFAFKVYFRSRKEHDMKYPLKRLITALFMAEPMPISSPTLKLTHFDKSFKS